MLVGTLADLLHIDRDQFDLYRIDRGGRTTQRHRAQIRKQLELQHVGRDDHDRLRSFVIERLGHGVPEKQLLEEADAHLRDGGFESPAAQLERLVRSGVRAYYEALYQRITEAIALECRDALDALLATDDEDGPGPSDFTTLRGEPGPIGVNSLIQEVDKLKRIRALNLPAERLDAVDPHQLRKLRQRAAVAKSRELVHMELPMRHAVVAAFLWSRSREITDELVELLIGIVHRIGARAERKVVSELVSDFKRVRGKQGLLFRVAEAALDTPEGTVSEVIFPVASEEVLRDLLAEFKATGNAYRTKVQLRMYSSYQRHYRRILPAILEALTFRSNNALHRPVLEAVEVLKKYAGRRQAFFKASEILPMDLVPETWRVALYDNKRRVLRVPYELCVLRALRERLRTKEIWVDGAYRFRNPDLDLPADYAQRQAEFYEALSMPLQATEFVDRLRAAMETGLSALDASLPNDPHVRIVGEQLSVSPYAAKPEPDNLVALKAELGARWPMVRLLDLLKEADELCEFTQLLRPDSSRLDEATLRRRLLLVLYAMGTNLGIKRVAAANPDDSYDDLLYVRRHYLDRERLRSAISRITDHLLAARDPLLWGRATCCASDSKRFGAWDQNLLTEWHQRYGGRGVMIYWHVERKATCIYSQLTRCSSSEAASMIEGVLRHCTTMEVDRQYVDTHGQSHVAFAFCHLLSFRLLPRIKAMGKQRLFRPRRDEPDRFANLKAVLSRPIKWELIAQQYDEMVKFATALRLGTAGAESILRRFTRNNLVHPTYQALTELSRAVKTVFLCDYLRSEALRREIGEGLNVVELWNGVNDFIFFGRGREISSNRREDQETSMLCLHLLQNSLVYLNTLMLQRVVDSPSWQGRLTERDRQGISPLLYAHVNPYGRFDLDMGARLAL